jgi:hypothetical protein
MKKIFEVVSNFDEQEVVSDEDFFIDAKGELFTTFNGEIESTNDRYTVNFLNDECINCIHSDKDGYIINNDMCLPCKNNTNYVDNFKIKE